MKRQTLSAKDRWSRSTTRLAPVVVRPDTPSNSASTNRLKCPDMYRGMAAMTARTIQADPVIVATLSNEEPRSHDDHPKQDEEADEEEQHDDVRHHGRSGVLHAASYVLPLFPHAGSLLHKSARVGERAGAGASTIKQSSLYLSRSSQLASRSIGGSTLQT